METAIGISLSLAVGMVLGLLYFTGLKWTVKALPSAKNKAALVLASFLVRMGVLLAALLAISAGEWERLVAGLLGIVAARMVTVHLYKPGTNENKPA